MCPCVSAKLLGECCQKSCFELGTEYGCKLRFVLLLLLHMACSGTAALSVKTGQCWALGFRLGSLCVWSAQPNVWPQVSAPSLAVCV